MVWEDWRHSTGSVYLARSLNGGLTFEPEVRVDDFGHRDLLLLQWPQVAVDGHGVVYVAFVAWMTGEVGQIYCVRSIDQGLTFEAPVRVSDADAGDRHWPAIAGDPAGGAHVVWCDFRNGEDVVDLYVSRSEDGTVFSPNVKANLAPVGPTCTPPLPKIAVSAPGSGWGGRVHIVWRQTTVWPERWIYACRSEDQGATFLPAVEVSHEPWSFDG